MVSQVMTLAGLEFGKEGAFQRIFTCCETSPDVSQEKPQYCIHAPELGCMFALVFQALALQKANRISPNSHMTAILITMRLAASPASPVKTLSVLLLA